MPLDSTPLLALLASSKNQPLRDSVCARIRALIMRGALRNGERLPSSRVLAADLGISRVTAEGAYAQLESEGYLARFTGRGTFVAATLPALSPTKRAPAPLPLALSQRGQQIVATGGCQDPRTPLAFAAGSPDLLAFPHGIWRKLINQRLRQQPENTLGYGDPQGHEALRQAVSDYLAQSRGVRCDAGQVIILTSSQQALQMLALLLCDPQDQVWLEEPGYSGARNAFTSAGAAIAPVAVDAEGAVVPAEGAAKLVYLTPSHQYPTGVAMSLARRLQWLAFARQQGSWLIEDDYDSEFYYEAQPMPALQGMDEQGRVLYLGTFSKVLFPSLRLAYLVVPPALVTPLCKLRSVMDGHSAQLMQAVTADFIHRGHFQAHLRLMRKLYSSRREHLLSALEKQLAGRVEVLSHSSGLQLTVMLPGGEEARLTQAGLASGLLLPRLSPLYAGPPQQSGWLLGFSALQPADIGAAVEKLARLPY